MPVIRVRLPKGFGVTYFIKDPSCLFAGGHFFVSVVEASFGVVPEVVSTGDDILLAVSKTNDPTGAYYIYDFPVEISPLSKNKPDEPAWVERFEIFIGGLEALPE